jgi:hypothetical protein
MSKCTRIAALAIVSVMLVLATIVTQGAPVGAEDLGMIGAGDLPQGVVRLAARHYLVSEPTANVLIYAGDDFSVVMGVQRPTLVARAKETLEKLHAAPVRYALMLDDEKALQYGDGGWGEAGAITMAYEKLFLRMRAARSRREPRDSVEAPVNDLPKMSFSAVVQLYSKDEEIHFIRERAGYTDSDVIVHCEKEGLLYLGNTFTMDGYPAVDLQRLGTMLGIIDTAKYFVREWGYDPDQIEPIVPGRGPIATMKDLREYRDMLVTVRDRVDQMVRAGQTVDEIVASRPTAEFDARWGHGPVSPEQFVRSLHRAVWNAWRASTK